MDYSGLLLTVALIGVFVLVGCVMRWMEQRRASRVRDAAHQLGLELVTQPDPELFQCLEGGMLLGSGHSARLWNLMQGKIGAHHVALFDFCDVADSGKGAKPG